MGDYLPMLMMAGTINEENAMTKTIKNMVNESVRVYYKAGIVFLAGVSEMARMSQTEFGDAMVEGMDEIMTMKLAEHLPTNEEFFEMVIEADKPARCAWNLMVNRLSVICDKIA